MIYLIFANIEAISPVRLNIIIVIILRTGLILNVRRFEIQLTHANVIRQCRSAAPAGWPSRVGRFALVVVSHYCARD